MSLRLLALLAFVSPLCAADAPATLLAQPDTEIFSDKLTKETPATTQWKIAKRPQKAGSSLRSLSLFVESQASIGPSIRRQSQTTSPYSTRPANSSRRKVCAS